MKKVASILAVAALTMGMVSCETESDVQETVDLFEVLDEEATDGDNTDVESREQ